MSSAWVVLGAGIMAAFNPCGVAMLPSYILHLLGGKERKTMDGFWAGILMTLGFLFVFLIAGLFAMVFSTVLGKYTAWIAFVVGILFVIVGVLMFFGKNVLGFHIDPNLKMKQGNRMTFLLYGVAYALGSLGCTLPLFSVLVLSSFHSNGFASGMTDFVLYALGMGFIVTVISLASTISQQIAIHWVRKSARWMGKLSAVITLGTGVYLLIYWFPYLAFK